MTRAKMAEILRRELELHEALKDSIYGDFAYSIEKVREDAMDKYLSWVQNEAFSKLTPGQKNG